MPNKPLPFFPEYLEYLRYVNPEEVLPILEQMCMMYWDGIPIDVSGMSNAAKAGIASVRLGISKSKEIRNKRTLAGAVGGSHGKGVSRNLENTNAKKSPSEKNNSKTIAKQKQINSKTIANQKQNNSEVEVEVEVEVDNQQESLGSTLRTRGQELLKDAATKDEVLAFANLYRKPGEPLGSFRDVIGSAYDKWANAPLKCHWHGLFKSLIEDFRRKGCFKGRKGGLTIVKPAKSEGFPNTPEWHQSAVGDFV